MWTLDAGQCTVDYPSPALNNPLQDAADNEVATTGQIVLSGHDDHPGDALTACLTSGLDTGKLIAMARATERFRLHTLFAFR